MMSKAYCSASPFENGVSRLDFLFLDFDPVGCPINRSLNGLGMAAVSLNETVIIAHKCKSFTDIHSELWDRPFLHHFYLRMIHVNSLFKNKMSKIDHVASKEFPH